MLSVVHRITIAAPKTHIVEVEVVVSESRALPGDIVLFMPVWSPGSYLVREYARHVEGLSAEAPARATKIRKNAWRVETQGAARVVVRYRVYANELTVRTNHVDETHAFLVNAALLLAVEGHTDTKARIEIKAPAGWQTITALPEVNGGYEAADYDTLVDSPIEIGTHREERFSVLGVPHRYSIWPSNGVPEARVTALVEDTKLVLEREAQLFGGTFPYTSYELLLHITPRTRGGLEHRSSAALMATPASFASREGYLDLLSLVAHEVFHAWNVKRIRPAGLVPYRYQEECYTRLLWWFEGGTSYYDWRVLTLAGIATVEEYLEHLAAEFAYLDTTPGRLVHALLDTSFDAWIKLYRPDENSANSTVSYYRKGEIVCALLDIEIRARSEGKTSLDTVLAHLWKEYGAHEHPVPEDGLLAIFERASGVRLGDLFDAWIAGSDELNPAPTLARVGLVLERSSRPDSVPCSLGVRLRTEKGRAVVVSVGRGSAAAKGGIDPDDEIIGVGGARVDGTTLDAVLRTHAPGEDVEVLVARDGRLLQRQVTLDRPKLDVVKLATIKGASQAARDAFERWLGRPHPAFTAAGKTP